MNRYEKITIKHMKREYFNKYLKLDNKYKDVNAPDFLFENSRNYQFIAEVKSIHKIPNSSIKTLKAELNVKLPNSLNSELIIKDTFDDVLPKWNGLIKKESSYSKLPYVIVIFNVESYWDNLGFLNDDVYRLFPEISAVFRLTMIDPKLNEYKNLNVEEHKRYIETIGISKISSRYTYKWLIRKNQYSSNKLNLNHFFNYSICT